MPQRMAVESAFVSGAGIGTVMVRTPSRYSAAAASYFAPTGSRSKGP